MQHGETWADGHTVAGTEKVGELLQESDVFLKVDLYGLTSEQREVVSNLLKEEAVSFPKNEDDMGCMESLQMGHWPVNQYTCSAKLYLNPMTSGSRSKELYWAFIKTNSSLPGHDHSTPLWVCVFKRKVGRCACVWIIDCSIVALFLISRVQETVVS